MPGATTHAAAQQEAIGTHVRRAPRSRRQPRGTRVTGLAGVC